MPNVNNLPLGGSLVSLRNIITLGVQHQIIVGVSAADKLHIQQQQLEEHMPFVSATMSHPVHFGSQRQHSKVAKNKGWLASTG